MSTSPFGSKVRNVKVKYWLCKNLSMEQMVQRALSLVDKQLGNDQQINMFINKTRPIYTPYTKDMYTGN